MGMVILGIAAIFVAPAIKLESQGRYSLDRPGLEETADGLPLQIPLYVSGCRGEEKGTGGLQMRLRG